VLPEAAAGRQLPPSGAVAAPLDDLAAVTHQIPTRSALKRSGPCLSAAARGVVALRTYVLYFPDGLPRGGPDDPEEAREVDDRMLRGMNALPHHAELMHLVVEPVRRLGWPRRARPRVGRLDRRLDRRLAAWLGGRLVRWGTGLAGYARPAAARRTT
jgi:hypothetical protein